MRAARTQTVLVVDDVDAMRYATARAIQSGGFEVVEASTGQEALKKAYEAPDLIVLDVHLPDIGGLEVCRRLKADPLTSSIPVLQLSATAVEAGDRAAGLELGADGYLTQPVEPMVLLATIRSLLRLRKAEREKEEEARQWDATFRALGDAICLLDAEGKILRHNLACEKIAAADANSIDGRCCYEALHRSTGFADDCPLLEARQTLERTERDMKVGEKYFRVTVDPVLDESGRLISIVHAMSDITDRRRASDALGESEKRYRHLFERNLAGVFIVAPDGRYLDCNETCARTLGFSSREELMEHNAVELFVDPADMQTAIATLLDQKSLVNLELRLKRKDGSTAVVLENVSLIENEYGERYVIEGTFIDISKRRRAEDDLHAAVENLALANAELERFAFSASHGLQEPARMVASFAQLLAQRYAGQMDEQADRYIDHLLGGAKRMLQIISALRTYSAISGSPLKLQPTAFEAILHSVIGSLQTEIQQSGASVEWGSLPVLMVDRLQFIQLLYNLLGNAIQFRRSDAPLRIQISAADTGAEWKISVRDNGIGVDPKYSEHIFEAFRHLPANGVASGSGMGLAICWKIIQRHQGRIWVESAAGQGSAFCFTIPKPSKQDL